MEYSGMFIGSALPIFTGFLYLAIGYLLWILMSQFVSKHPRLAPGPKGYPFIGNTLQVPIVKPWLYFERLGSQYGPMVRLSLGGNEVLVLHDPSDAEELLVRRSTNYSSRKPLIYAGKYQSHDKRIALLPYGAELKRQRTAFYQMMQQRVVGSYERMQELESTKLIYDMLTRPEKAEMNVQRYAASLVFTLNYGKRLGDNDQDLLAVLDVLKNFVDECHPGAHLVDTFPVLDKILPGFLAPWRAEAEKKHKNEMKLYTRLVLEAKKKMEEGQKDLECFAARLWEQQKKLNLDLMTLSYIVGSAFEAGTDTTSGTILWFLMAMILFPETMQRAHAELDSVFGPDAETIPTFQHFDQLPYCVSLVKEVLRWMPVSRIAPHYSDAEDEYKEYTIKANTLVIPCIWSMQHNEKLFPDPLTFNPDRFLQSKVSSPNEVLTEGHFAFGFGRRICPGRYLASRSVWIGITRLLWAFNIGPGIDEAGKPIPVDPYDCTSGITSHPCPFAVTITPRSEAHAKTIQNAWADAI